jgi:hypothetical protein
MFRSRRSEAPPPETAKVAQVVQAYYDAGKRPASHLSPLPVPIQVEVAAEAPEDEPFAWPEPELSAEPEPAPLATPQPVAAEPLEQPSPVHKSLAELAEELETFIEVIRYGDDLGGRTARN